MNAKLLLFLTWVFYLTERRTSDSIWFFCMIYSAILTLCAFFYSLENSSAKPAKNKKRK